MSSAKTYFKEGWPLFIPYLVIYWVAWSLGFPVPILTRIFGLIHLIHAVSLAFLLHRWRREIERMDWLFWILIFLLLLIPGAYLEYPADPWEHFRRLLTWQGSQQISDNEFRHKFAYFWNWTCMARFEIAARRTIADYLSAFWQWFVLYQWYLVCLAVGQTKRLARVQAIVFLALFGTNVFGLRYYALSSMPLAYVGYLACLRYLLARRTILLVAICIPLILANHVQEGVFVLGAIAAVLFVRGLPYLRNRLSSRAIFLGILFVLVGSLAFGIMHQHFRPFFYTRLGSEYFTQFGLFKIWSYQSRVLDTLGIAGVVSILFSLAFYRRFPLAATLTVLPVISLLLPPIFYGIGLRIHNASDVYRLLYLVPSSFMLVSGLEVCITKVTHKNCVGVVLLLALALGSFPQFPWRGRIYSQLYTPGVVRSLKILDETAQWFKDHRHYSGDCWIISDDATRFVLAVHLGRHVISEHPPHDIRLHPNLFGRKMVNTDILEKMMRPRNICGILVPIRERIPEAPSSPLAILSNHWDERLADLRWLVTDEFVATSRQMVSKGWIHTPVPPFFDLYEPPR